MIHYLGEGTVNLATTRGCNRWQPVPGPRVGSAPQMSYLTHERTVVLMDALGEFQKVWNNRITREVHNAGGSGRVLGHAGRATEHGQCDATLGLFFVVELVAFLRSTVNRIQHRVTRAHDAVLERQMTQLKWLQ